MAGKSGRNDPCPCGSGKKYKKCCLSKSSGQNNMLNIQEMDEYDEYPELLEDSFADLHDTIVDEVDMYKCFFQIPEARDLLPEEEIQYRVQTVFDSYCRETTNYALELPLSEKEQAVQNSILARAIEETAVDLFTQDRILRLIHELTQLLKSLHQQGRQNRKIAAEALEQLKRHKGPVTAQTAILGLVTAAFSSHMSELANRILHQERMDEITDQVREMNQDALAGILAEAGIDFNAETFQKDTMNYKSSRWFYREHYYKSIEDQPAEDRFRVATAVTYLWKDLLGRPSYELMEDLILEGYRHEPDCPSREKLNVWAQARDMLCLLIPEDIDCVDDANDVLMPYLNGDPISWIVDYYECLQAAVNQSTADKTELSQFRSKFYKRFPHCVGFLEQL